MCILLQLLLDSARRSIWRLSLHWITVSLRLKLLIIVHIWSLLRLLIILLIIWWLWRICSIKCLQIRCQRWTISFCVPTLATVIALSFSLGRSRTFIPRRKSELLLLLLRLLIWWYILCLHYWCLSWCILCLCSRHALLLLYWQTRCRICQSRYDTHAITHYRWDLRLAVSNR